MNRFSRILVVIEDANKDLTKLIMIAKKVIRSESANKVILYDNDDDMSCWNCAKRTNSETCLETVTLAKVRQQHREKFKLYSFLASELSKPKVVPLKQKISEPLTITRIIDEKLVEDAKVCDHKDSCESNLKILPLNTDVHVYQNSTENTVLTQKQGLDKTKTRKRIIEGSNGDNKSEKYNKISPSRGLSEPIEDNTQESVTILYKLEIETPSKIKRDENEVITKINFLQNDDIANKEFSQVYFKEIKDNCVKIDNVNLNSPNFDNTVSSFRDINEQIVSNNTMRSSEPLNVGNLNDCQEFEKSMPVLCTSSQKANETFTKSMNSLSAESNFNKKVKMMRWSSFSLCKEPYDNNGMFHNLLFVQFVVVCSRTHVSMHQSPLLWTKNIDSDSGAARIMHTKFEQSFQPQLTADIAMFCIVPYRGYYRLAYTNRKQPKRWIR